MKELSKELTNNLRTSWPNFSEKELKCSCCGKTNPNPEFVELMDKVQQLRDQLGFGLAVSSAYRCENHPIEAEKIAKGKTGGEHTRAAIDLKVSYNNSYKLLEEALRMRFTGIGINQKGETYQRFIHLDLRPQEQATVWSY